MCVRVQVKPATDQRVVSELTPREGTVGCALQLETWGNSRHRSHSLQLQFPTKRHVTITDPQSHHLLALLHQGAERLLLPSPAPCSASVPIQPTPCAVLPASSNAGDSWVMADTNGRSEDPPQFKYVFFVMFAKLCLKGMTAKLTKE